MPFAPGHFDVVMATFPAPYILDPATLQEVARVLRDPDQTSQRPGGRLVIVGLFVETDYEILQRLAPFFFGSPSEEFIRIYRRMAAEAGFALRIVPQATRGFRSPVFILEREPAA
jgi:hypothetical protein